MGPRLQGDPIGCRPGNVEKLSSSQAEPGQAIKSVQLLLSFPPFPVRHPVHAQSSYLRIVTSKNWPHVLDDLASVRHMHACLDYILLLDA